MVETIVFQVPTLYVKGGVQTIAALKSISRKMALKKSIMLVPQQQELKRWMVNFQAVDIPEHGIAQEHSIVLQKYILQLHFYARPR